jgi:hypothetical protein
LNENLNQILRKKMGKDRHNRDEIGENSNGDDEWLSHMSKS